jgi:hypothetical protein
MGKELSAPINRVNLWPATAALGGKSVIAFISSMGRHNNTNVTQADTPATIILTDHTKPIDTSRLSLEELPTRCTVGQLHAVLAISPNSSILVIYLCYVAC